MKTATIRTILEGRKKEMEKYLSRFAKELKDMEKERYLPHAPEVMNSLTHQIGYMTGAIEQTKEFLHMLEVTDKAYFKHEREVQEHNKAVMDQLKESIKKRRMT
jgi:hypothetical protein